LTSYVALLDVKGRQIVEKRRERWG